jgi:hypothetical protein
MIAAVPDYATLFAGILWALAPRARTCGDFVGTRAGRPWRTPGPAKRGPWVPESRPPAGTSQVPEAPAQGGGTRMRRSAVSAATWP